MSALASVDPLLVDAVGHTECLLGNEAIVRAALESGVGFACGYPGTPSSEITDGFARVAGARGIAFEYSVNEKIALEMAFAASLAGARSICAMKHLGLMVAGDPLSTIPYIGVVGGLVIVSAGDPSCHTSPNEQDQRYLGPMLHVPTLDPSTAQEAYELTRLAFDLSERSKLPVLLRVTTRVCHTRATVTYGALRAPEVRGFTRDPKRFVPIPPNARRLRLEIGPRLEVARAETEALFRSSGAGSDLVLATGGPAATVKDVLAELGAEEQVVLATMPGVFPLPEDALGALIEAADRVLVVEELSPFLEDAVRALCARKQLHAQVLGKRTGHFPEPFEYGPEVLRRGLHDALGLGPEPATAVEPELVTPRPPVLCSGCPHRATYFAARTALGPDRLYFNDIGCYTLGFDPPLGMADALLCMGAGFTLAAGVSRMTGERTVGFLGDSTFFHSGMPALLDAIKQDADMVAVILDNEVTAMTGFQESPTVEVHEGRPKRRVSIEGVVRALGAEHVETVDPADLGATVAAFERARDATGLAVVVAEHPCPVYAARLGAPPPEQAFEIVDALCGTCGRAELRCGQCVTEGQERSMSLARVREPGEAPPEAVAPCGTRCPIALCVQGYASHIAAGQYQDAFELILSRTPLPHSVCRVCHRPCESACVLAAEGAPVAVNDLKRFVMDWAVETGATWAPERDPEHGRRVAVVGAGPAGLAAAHDLALRGYRVTVFDAAEAPGGLLRTGVPAFRLPDEALERDLAGIAELGVEFVGGARLGQELDLEGLRAEHEAVFLAIGARVPRQLELEAVAGGGAEVVPVLDYLAGARLARHVVVAGGGNAAIDAARTAHRRGAVSVVAVFPETLAEMRALAEEVEAAEREGIELRPGLTPRALSPEGLVCAAADGSVVLPAELVVVAIGHDPDLSALASLDRGPDATLRVDPETSETSLAGVFAGGDLVAGARTVTGAIAAGQRAAWGIDLSLRGRALAEVRPPPARPEGWQHHAQRSCAPVRQGGFGERATPPEGGALTEAQARAEAARCMVCGRCGNCRACLDLFGCPAFHLDAAGAIRIDPQLCNGCGQCADLCPNGAIRPVPSTP